ncbi:phosphoribosyl-ATP pyrophosphohydrolase/phosphoribosyl-AMP cyclohydrolase [Caldicoprobacter guelmensis]|uniref:bifunctional phosphoribosyl-AMP cyclohydrolase/phosphoribosyl-ATP diphosphatase HisIE n=1 Tax=Caldicoprobacter guelmensis TaxID=1170224 RepID=UPI001FAF6F8D|nr:bifunctional phosphoribosyl-AMP cyclohydrolase/phosphoribosyl-ATP diphosphatase HisIE [Caldicoprobacter guelmensis]MBM7581491.1 phosphoribosyl-ATP pyrophosphohydrolase/phosphoribosyl-AMP cyclohydrolase [Caldicoprobacter guelmensis]
MLMDEVKFNSDGLIPSIIQDKNTGEVLMLGYMNRQALQKSLETGITHFWSRTRRKLWMKGETSGHIQKIEEVFIDCDGDALLFKVEQVKAACHTGYKSCFYRCADKVSDEWVVKGERVFIPDEVYADAKKENEHKVNSMAEQPSSEMHKELFEKQNCPDTKASVLRELYDVIVDRKLHPREGSYTCYLFEKGIDKILKKVGEEASEVIIAAKNRVKSEVIYEVSDLMYHLLVLLVEQGITLDEIYDELKRRR